MPPTFGNGKICYLQIPAEDISHSASFYQQVFGWNIRQNTDGHTSFDDTVGEVSGAWVTDRPPATTPGLLVYIMVDSVAASIDAIKAAGGTIVQPIGGDPGEITARFSDPAGNVVGLYEHNTKT
jgi:predicted enzyme related to lactoylglutathione lyase